MINFSSNNKNKINNFKIQNFNSVILKILYHQRNKQINKIKIILIEVKLKKFNLITNVSVKKYNYN